jgi:hypothetical protein
LQLNVIKDKAFFDLLSNNREFIAAIAPHQHINNGFCWETNNKGEITLDKYCPACVKIQTVTGGILKTLMKKRNNDLPTLQSTNPRTNPRPTAANILPELF